MLHIVQLVWVLSAMLLFAVLICQYTCVSFVFVYIYVFIYVYIYVYVVWQVNVGTRASSNDSDPIKFNPGRAMGGFGAPPPPSSSDQPGDQPVDFAMVPALGTVLSMSFQVRLIF